MRKVAKMLLGIRNERGTTAVEFAVIAALLFLILFGILEFGFIFMQEHYIANAAREGVRIGVRANNFNCFVSTTEEGCAEVAASDRVFRSQRIIDSIKNGYTIDGDFKRPYLEALYGIANPNVNVVVSRTPDNADPDNTQKILRVAVTAPNIFPPIISGLASLIPGAGFDLPRNISFTAEGEYEDPNEP